MPRNRPLPQRLDWTIIIIYLVLVIMGWLSVYGASYDFENPASIFDFDQRAGKQFIWILTGFAIAGIVLLIDAKVYNYFAYIIYATVVVLLIITIFIAPDIKGSRSWIVIGSVNFQPAETAKVATSLVLARFMSAYNYKFRTWKDIFPLLGFVLLPMALIILQKETGSALVFIAFFLVFYREGMNGIIILFGLLAVLLFVIVIRFSAVEIGSGSLGFILAMGIVLLIQLVYSLAFRKDKQGMVALFGAVAIAVVSYVLFYFFEVKINFNYIAIAIIFLSAIFWIVQELFYRKKQYRTIVLISIVSVIFCYSSEYLFERVLQPHQQLRIKVLLNMEDDLSGAGYNVNQSKIAIGSGGLFGKGFLNGTQTKLKYVPEQDTDFIFCTVGEEHGFAGSIAVLALYAFLLVRLLKIAERQHYAFSRVYGYCVASILFFHLVINVGMVLGLMPVIGIPLPFFSYGGSSLWGFTVMLFILIKLDSEKR
ncbi:MAG: rod shape-determining protein RodA [Prevotellaceae bacterium]|jgi:rod shape determining protein RodA|nr:rod shape-determining protein RodA [Prevotellaceae bacterium]